MLKLVNNNKKYWEFIRSLRTNPLTQKGFHQKINITEEQQLQFMKKNSSNYKICLLNGENVGYVGNISPNSFIGEITYCVDPSFQGNGIGTFMVKEFLKTNPKIMASVKHSNRSSQRVFEKLGFEKVINKIDIKYFNKY